MEQNTGWGDQLLAPIDEHKDKKKEIPEHLSTRDRFDELMEREWKPGLDVAKKFDMHVLLGGLDFDKIRERADKMKWSYEENGS